MSLLLCNGTKIQASLKRDDRSVVIRGGFSGCPSETVDASEIPRHPNHLGWC